MQLKNIIALSLTGLALAAPAPLHATTNSTVFHGGHNFSTFGSLAHNYTRSGASYNSMPIEEEDVEIETAGAKVNSFRFAMKCFFSFSMASGCEKSCHALAACT